MAMILKLSSIFGVELVAMHSSNSKNGANVSQITEPERLTFDIQLEKDHKLVCVGKYLICVKCPPYEVQSAFLSHSGCKPHDKLQ